MGRRAMADEDQVEILGGDAGEVGKATVQRAASEPSGDGDLAGKVGDPIRLAEQDFERLANAIFDKIERKS